MAAERNLFAMIHTFTALGQYLVADVNSGAVHVLDRMSYDLLSLLEKEETMGETCPREIRERLTQYSDQEVDETWRSCGAFRRPAPVFQRRLSGPGGRHGAAQAGRGQGPLPPCLPPTATCACRYCFASTGDFGTGTA